MRDRHRARPHAGQALLLAVALIVSVGVHDPAGAGAGAGAGAPVPEASPWPSAAEANAAIGRGVEVLSPCCGQDGIPGDIAARAEAVRSAGFTGVRYAVKFSPAQSSAPPYLVDPAYLDQIRAEIDVLTDAGLTVVLLNNEGLNEPDRSGDRLVSLWTQLAERFQDLPPSVYFEIANEPNWAAGATFSAENAVTSDQWNAVVARVIPAIRATNPLRTVVVSSAYWSLPGAIPELVLPTDDGHLIATFHLYAPLTFTHQGSWIAGSEAWIGTTWTGTDQEIADMQAAMEGAVCWSRATGVPLFLGEFSSYTAGTYTDQDPMLWNKTVVQLADAEDISWTYFLLNGTWDPTTARLNQEALWDEALDRWNQPVLDALAEARAEPVDSWADCPDGEPPVAAPVTTVTSAPPASSPGRAVAAAPRITG